MNAVKISFHIMFPATQRPDCAIGQDIAYELLEMYRQQRKHPYAMVYQRPENLSLKTYNVHDDEGNSQCVAAVSADEALRRWAEDFGIRVEVVGDGDLTNPGEFNVKG